jgi:hypothetical protein
MILSPAFVRVCLVVCMVGMALLAALYLRGRKLTWWEYLGWGLFALLIPILGPFLTILLRPGNPRQFPLPKLFSRKVRADKSTN